LSSEFRYVSNRLPTSLAVVLSPTNAWIVEAKETREVYLTRQADLLNRNLTTDLTDHLFSFLI